MSKSEEDVAVSLFFGVLFLGLIIAFFSLLVAFLFIGIPFMFFLWAFFRVLINTFRSYWLRYNLTNYCNLEKCKTLPDKEKMIQTYGNLIKMIVRSHSSYTDPLGGLLGRNSFKCQKVIACITLPIVRVALPLGILLCNGILSVYALFTHVDN